MAAPDLVLRSPRADDTRGIPVWTGLVAVPGSEVLTVHAPRSVGRAIVEIKADPDIRARVRQLVAVLRHADFEVVVSRPSARFAITELLRAWIAPVARFLALKNADGQAQSAVAGASLLALGFGADPLAVGLADLTSSEAAALAELVEPAGAVSHETIARLAQVTAGSDAEPDRELMSAITLSLLDGVRGCAEQGGLAQPRAADVIAREVLGFPLSMQSLCSWLSPSRVEGALASAQPGLVDHAVIQHAKEFVTRDQPFYR